jgi:hypothetical protein
LPGKAWNQDPFYRGLLVGLVCRQPPFLRMKVLTTPNRGSMVVPDSAIGQTGGPNVSEQWPGRQERLDPIDSQNAGPVHSMR